MSRLTDWPAMSSVPRPTRRTVLLGTLAVPLAGCRPHRFRTGGPPAPGATADVDALRRAVADEEGLLLMLARMTAAGFVLEKEQGVHADHLVALRAALGTASATPTAAGPMSSDSSTSDSTTTARRKALSRDFDRRRARSAHRLRAISLAATDGAEAALLASIAACHSAPVAWDGARFAGSRP